MNREDLATDILYSWACEHTNTADAKRDLLDIGYSVDFRQADLGNIIDGFDVFSDNPIAFEV